MTGGVTTILPVLIRQPASRDLALLTRAIESVLSQECGIPQELLIVDDGSPSPVESFSLPTDTRIRHIRLARNYGIAHALNVGLTQSKYSLIARIDADDNWRAGKLAKQLSRFDSDPDLTLVASGLRVVHTANSDLDRDEVRGGDWAHVLALTERIGCPFPHASILARREVFEILGGYPQSVASRHAEDFTLWALWIRFFKVAICDEILVDYLISDSQISSVFAEEQQRASTAPRRLLAALADRTHVPDSIQELASSLGMTLLDTSKALFQAWRYYQHILVEPGHFDAAVKVLPDRAVHRLEELDTLLTDTVFKLEKRST